MLILSRKWNTSLYNKICRYSQSQIRRRTQDLLLVKNARTMPDLKELNIGTAKRTTIAILFFDLVDFTTISSHINQEDTLKILNVITSTVMLIVREWKGTVEKHTGDGIMAILGTETNELEVIAREAIEVVQTIKYVMIYDILPKLMKANLPKINFRIGLDMGEVLISRIGLPHMNFLTVVGSAANRASKLEALAQPNGITIGSNIVKYIHPHLQRYLEKGTNEDWDWSYKDSAVPYNYYHYLYQWADPSIWPKESFRLQREYRNLTQ